MYKLTNKVVRGIVNMNKLNVSWLEIPLAKHCNLKCKCCTHHSPYMSPDFYDYEQFKRDINALKDIYHTRVLMFLGGEPLLNKRINDYIEFAKESKIADIYTVTTNGVLLTKMNDTFFKLVDDIQISLYPDAKIDRKELEHFLNEKLNMFNFTYSISDIEYFMDIETDKLSDKKAQTNFNMCYRRQTGHLIYNGYYYKCMRPLSTGEYLATKNKSEDIYNFMTEDGIQLNSPNLYLTLKNYINCKQKLLSCNYCLLGFSYDSAYDKLKNAIIKHKLIRNFLYKFSGVYSIFKRFDKIHTNNKYDTYRNIKKTKNNIVVLKHSQLNKDEYRNNSQ